MCETLEAISDDVGIVPVTVLHLTDGSYALLNPTEWIEKLCPQVILLSVADGDRSGLASPETLEAVQGYTHPKTPILSSSSKIASKTPGANKLTPGHGFCIMRDGETIYQG